MVTCVCRNVEEYASFMHEKYNRNVNTSAVTDPDLTDLFSSQ